jgi:regulatory protein
LTDQEQPQHCKPDYVRERAMRLLVAREHSQHELCRKLIERSLDPQVVEQVVADLAEEGLQSDLRYAEAYARSRAARGFGLAGVVYELKGRGVTSRVIDLALEEAAIDWQQIARKALAKKFRLSDATTDVQSKMRRYLYSRGFDSDQATDAIRALRNDVKS